jgi:hypothetical protein
VLTQIHGSGRQKSHASQLADLSVTGGGHAGGADV